MTDSSFGAALLQDVEAIEPRPDLAEMVIRGARSRRRRRRTTAAAAAAVLAGSAVVAVVVAGNGSVSSGGSATLVPAAPPRSTGNVESLAKPLELGGSVRLDPAGTPPTSTASYERFTAADKSRPLAGPGATTKVVYGLLSIDDAGVFQQSQSLGAEPFARTLMRYPVVVIVHATPWPDAGKTLMAYAVLEPKTAQPLYAFGQDYRLWVPAQSPIDLGYYAPEVKSAIPGITRDAGPFPKSLFQTTTKWVYDLGYKKQLGRHAYLTVYAGSYRSLYGQKPPKEPEAAIVVVLPAYLVQAGSNNRVAAQFAGGYPDGELVTGSFSIVKATPDTYHTVTLTLLHIGAGDMFKVKVDQYGRAGFLPTPTR